MQVNGLLMEKTPTPIMVNLRMNSMEEYFELIECLQAQKRFLGVSSKRGRLMDRLLRELETKK